MRGLLVAVVQQVVAVGIADIGGIGGDTISGSSSTTHVDGGQAVNRLVVECGIISMFRHVWIAQHVHAGEGHTATAEDRALYGAAIHIDGDIARHTTVGVVGVKEVTTAAEDVAVPSGETIVADIGS